MVLCGVTSEVMSSLYGGSFAATGRTTAMLKNVPAKYTQRKLMRELLGRELRSAATVVCGASVSVDDLVLNSAFGL